MDAGIPLPIPHAAGAAVALFLLAVVPLVGRIFLAWLPPGRPGGHAPRELPATWAASFLVGLVWFLAVGEIAPGEAWAAAAFGIPTLALAARILTSPAGLVPRHEPVPLRAAGAARATIGVLVLATGAWTARRFGSDTGLLLALSTCAAVVLAHEALALARVQPWLRAATLAAVAAAIALLPHRAGAHEAYATIGACGIAAGIAGWIRRGDQRALAIASFGSAFLVLCRSGDSAFAMVLAVGVAAVIGTAKPSRLQALAWLAGGLVASVAVLHIGGRMSARTYISRTPAAATVELALALLVVFAAAATYRLRIRRTTPAWNPSGAPESREASVLGYAAIAAIALTHALSCRGFDDPLEDSGYPINSPVSASGLVLLVIAVAIPLARTLDRTRTA